MFKNLSRINKASLIAFYSVFIISVSLTSYFTFYRMGVDIFITVFIFSFIALMISGLNCTIQGVFEKFTKLNSIFAFIAVSSVAIMMVACISTGFSFERDSILLDLFRILCCVIFFSFFAALSSGQIGNKE